MEEKNLVSMSLAQENEELKKELAEQNEYIKKLMLIKKKSDEALLQLRENIEMLKNSSSELKEQLRISETEKEKLQLIINELKTQSVAKEVTSTDISEKVTDEKRNIEAELLAKHIKVMQVTNQKLENRLSEVEKELEKLKSISLSPVRRKKSRK
jgi:chromosome segregation ATPase